MWRVVVLLLGVAVTGPAIAQPGSSPAPPDIPLPDLPDQLGWTLPADAQARVRELEQEVASDPKSPLAAERWLEMGYLYDAVLDDPLKAAEAYRRAGAGVAGAGGCGGAAPGPPATEAGRYLYWAQFRAGELLMQLEGHQKEARGALEAFYYAEVRLRDEQREGYYLPARIEERALFLGDQLARGGLFYRIFDVLVGLMGRRPGVSHALALVLLALLLKALFFPLMRKQYESMIKMQRINPILQEIQRKHKGDPQKAQKAMMEAYREYGVHPLGSCLPMLVQMPLLIMVYQGIRSYIYQFDRGGLLWIGSLADTDVPLLLIYAVSMFVQQRLTSSLTPKPADPAAQQQHQQQQKMMMFMPIFFTYMMYVWQLPSAFYFYWIAYNVFSTLEQRWVMQQMRADPSGSVAVPVVPATADGGKGGRKRQRQLPVTVLGDRPRRGRRGRRSRR